LSREIIIGFSRPNMKFPILSWLIRFLENTNYSHVYVSWYSNILQDYISYEAVGKSVRFLGPTAFKKRIIPVKQYKLKMNDQQYRELLKICLSEAGKSYGILQLIGLAFDRFLPRKGNPFPNKQDKYICSELVLIILQKVFGVGLDLDPDTISPYQIEQLLVQNLHKLKT